MTDGAEPGRPIHYVVITSDRAAQEQEDAVFHLSRLVGPDYATAWYIHLSRAIQDLPVFPGPRSHAIDEEASLRYGCEVRRMLYFGPGARRSRTPYRVLFTIFSPGRDEDESTILVLRILHGAQQLADESEPNGGDNNGDPPKP